MRKICVNINDVIQQITKLKGEKIKMQVNKGRKKIVKYTGVVDGVYPSIFTVKLLDCASVPSFSCSYAEVLCGNVKILEQKIVK